MRSILYALCHFNLSNNFMEISVVFISFYKWKLKPRSQEISSGVMKKNGGAQCVGTELCDSVAPALYFLKALLGLLQ